MPIKVCLQVWCFGFSVVVVLKGRAEGDQVQAHRSGAFMVGPFVEDESREILKDEIHFWERVFESLPTADRFGEAQAFARVAVRGNASLSSPGNKPKNSNDGERKRRSTV